jgi:hypothetical protein
MFRHVVDTDCRDTLPRMLYVCGYTAYECDDVRAPFLH